MKKINVLHIAEIDDDMTKGTSTIIPQYIFEQNKNNQLNVSFLNCNDLHLQLKLFDDKVYILTDNLNNDVIKKVKPDIVVFHELYKKKYLKIYKHLVKNKIPYIIIPHGGMTVKAQNHKKIKKIIGNFLFFNSFFKKASKIQYLSQKEKDNTYFKSLNYYILGNGIENIPSKNLYLNNNNLKSDYLSFIYVGRYDYFIKGLDQLLGAFLKIKQSGINAVLNLYGKGDSGTCKKIKEFIFNNNLEDIVHYNGPVYNEEKRECILKNDIFIQVSRTEGQPLGVMEAMAIGMPVLLSHGTGYNDVIKENKIGFIVKTNAESIFDTIRKLVINNVNLDDYSKESYDYAVSNYSWKSIVNKSIDIYEKILNK